MNDGLLKIMISFLCIISNILWTEKVNITCLHRQQLKINA